MVFFHSEYHFKNVPKRLNRDLIVIKLTNTAIEGKRRFLLSGENGSLSYHESEARNEKEKT